MTRYILFLARPCASLCLHHAMCSPSIALQDLCNSQPCKYEDPSFFHHTTINYKPDSRGEEEEEDNKTLHSCLQSSSDLIMICTQLFEKLHRHLHR